MNKQTAVIVTIFILLLGSIVLLNSQQSKEISLILENKSAESVLISGDIKVKEQSVGEIKTKEESKNEGDLIAEGNSINKADVNVDIDEEIFSDVKIGQTSDSEWVINLKNLSEDKKKETKKKMLSVLDKINTKLDTKSNLGLIIKSPIGIVTIKKQGVLINKIFANMLINLGFREGDVIKSINNHEVNSMKDIYSVYRTIKDNPAIALFSVKYERNGALMNAKYRVN